jgi:hypothetical protein
MKYLNEIQQMMCDDYKAFVQALYFIETEETEKLYDEAYWAWYMSLDEPLINPDFQWLQGEVLKNLDDEE